MQITTQNVRAIFRQSGDTLSGYCGPRILKNWLHDNSYHCDQCNERFTDADEVDDGTCTECGSGWRGFDARREWGTY